jgi:hypothetical protein
MLHAHYMHVVCSVLNAYPLMRAVSLSLLVYYTFYHTLCVCVCVCVCVRVCVCVCVCVLLL